MNYLDLSIVEIHDAIIQGKVTPLELVLESLKRAKESNDNAFECILEEEAIEAVKKLDKSKINNLLYGIPYVLKDNFSTKDVPTTASSNILNGYVPIFDSEVYQRLKEQGAILIAKATLDELAMGGSGTTGHKGITYNPYDTEHKHIIGGSSCGSAASVAAGIVPFAIGSDTGDSVRKPASYAGLVGFKPTWGRISRFGLFPFATSLDHVGYFTRNIYDCGVLTNVLSGRDEKDASSSFKEVSDYTLNIKSDIAGKRIAVINQIYHSVHNENILNSFNKSLDILRSFGAKVDFVDMSEDLLKAIFPTYIVISCAEATSNNANLDGIKFGPRSNGDTYEEVMTNTRTKGFSELIKRRFVIGSFALNKENQDVLFVRAQKARRLIVDAFNDVFREYDAIYLPASPSVAPEIKTQMKDSLSLEYLIADNYLAFGNFGGFPSLTLPLGFENGLPYGGNITCRPFEESTVLNISYHLESKMGLANIIARKD